LCRYTAVPSFVAPLITTAVASIVLGERPHWGTWAAFPVCMFGAALVVQPSVGLYKLKSI
jgi:drug/metabolite transporter (DMT)-like permease